MELIIFEKETYYKMMATIMGMFKDALKEAKLEHLKDREEIDWIDDKEAKELLAVKSKTKMQQLRNAGEIVLLSMVRK